MIIEFDTCLVDNSDWGRANLKEKTRHDSGREELHVLLQWEKTCICRKALHRQHIYCLAYEIEELGIYGKDYNISKIADYACFDLNQLRELDISKNAIKLLYSMG